MAQLVADNLDVVPGMQGMQAKLFVEVVSSTLKSIWTSVTTPIGMVAEKTGVAALLGTSCKADGSITNMDQVMNVERPEEDDGHPISMTQKLMLRICVHHGEELPLERTYLQVVVQASPSDEIKTFNSRAASSSNNPVWDFLVEQEIEVRANRVPSIEIRVLSWQLVGPRELGSAFLMASIHGGHVHRQELTLKAADSFLPSFSTPLTSKIMVAWQLCNPSAFRPDLSRVAEMSSMALTKRIFRMQMDVRRLELLKGVVGAIPGVDADKPETFEYIPDMCIRINCMKLDEAGQKDEAVVYSEEVKVAMKQGKIGKHMVFRVDETVDGTKDPRAGQMSWVLLENEISLMNYQLELSCIMLPKEGNNNNNSNANQMEEPPRLTKEKVVGTWKGLLADLHDKISNTKRKQHFAAQLTSYDLRVGHIEVIFDASEAGEDEHEDALTLMARGSIPVNAGDAKQAWESHGTFYVGIAACGLRLPSPMVRVYSAHGCHECRTYQVNAAGDFIEFADFLPVAVSKYRQKVRIELWSESNFLDAFSIRERLVGEASVYAATPGRREWKHLYGGALLSNYRHHEEQMTRGSLAPSTYRGSLFLNFSARPGTGGTVMQELVTTHRKKAYLSVKLYRGIYMDMYRNQKVHVLIQLAGCTIGWDKSQQRNFNLLSFPAQVDKNGIMHFLGHDGWNLFSEVNGWVNRRTSEEQEALLEVPKESSTARFFIVLKGEEDKPPKSFGKMLISLGKEREPRWTRVTYDQSVIQLPEEDRLFKDDLAGFILGSATVVYPPPKKEKGATKTDNSDGGKNQMAQTGSLDLATRSTNLLMDDGEVAQDVLVKGIQPSKKKCLMVKPGSVLCQPCMAERVLQVGDLGADVKCCVKNRVQVWCHIDMLAARCLPAADKDGVADVTYEIRVGDQAVLFGDVIRSLNPTFMHRLVIGPIEVEADEKVKVAKDDAKVDKSDLLDLPPIVVRMLDSDNDEVSFGEKYELLGRAIVHNPFFLDHPDAVVDGKDGKQLDVNTVHSPAWYSLESEGQTRFIRSNAGATCDESWNDRPRLLMAAGYSFCPRWKTSEKIEWGQDCTIAALKSEKADGQANEVSFDLTLDVLGLRHLGSSEKTLLEDKMELKISSYWVEQSNPILKLDGTHSTSKGGATSTFCGHKVEDEDNMLFKRRAKGLLEFQDREDDDEATRATEQADAEDSYLGSQDDSPRSVKSLGVSASRDRLTSNVKGAIVVSNQDVVGWKVKLPRYTVPVVPYLQKDRDDTVAAFGQPNDAAPLPVGTGAARPKQQISGSDGPFVMLPDIVFQLKNGKHDCGTLCLHLPAKYGQLPSSLRKVIRKAIRTRKIVVPWKKEAGAGDFLKLEEDDMVEVLKHDLHTGWAFGVKVYSSTTGAKSEAEIEEQGWFPDWAVDPSSNKSWAEVAAEEFSSLPPAIRSIARIERVAESGEACDYFVDVFASMAGKLRWNSKLQLGRLLLDQHLFTIEPEPPEDDDKDPEPHFFNPADWMFGDPKAEEEPFDERVTPTFSCATQPVDKHHPTPLLRSLAKPQTAWWVHMEETHHKQAREKMQQDMEAGRLSTSAAIPDEKMHLKELTRLAAQKGFRLVSKDHVPEATPPERPQAFHKEIDDIHNQTYMVHVGHRVERSDPESGKLARLKIGMPSSKAKQKKEAVTVRSTQGDSYKFSLTGNRTIKICKDKSYLISMRADRALEVVEDGATRAVQLSKDRAPLQVAPDQFHQLQKALNLFRAAEEQEDAGNEAAQTVSDETPSYLLIKYRHSGTVIWAAPPEVFEWQVTGALLFIVMEDSGRYVGVRTPSFDLRFKQECCWYPIKIQMSHGEVTELAAQIALEKQQAERERQKGGQHQHAHAAAKNTNPHKNKSDINGIRDSMRVIKNSFCCRLKMAHCCSPNFSRPGTKNWYRTMLTEVYPEVDKLQKVPATMDAELVKHFFLHRHMNIRQPMLTLGQKEACLLKGHVQVDEVKSDPKSQDGGTSSGWMGAFFGGRREKEDHEVLEKNKHLLPLSHLWVQNHVKIRVSVLTIRGLLVDSNVSLEGAQVVVTLNRHDGNVSTSRFHATMLEHDRQSLDVYTHASMDAVLAGEANLIIEVWSDASWSSSASKVARAQIDLEDRWFALQGRQLRQASNQQWIMKNLSEPSFGHAEDTAEMIKSGRRTWTENPYLATATLQPIESVALYDADPLFADRQVGSMRLWVDMVEESYSLPEVHFSTGKKEEFEVRIRVKDVDGISVFKDFGERNDVYIKAELSIQSPGGGLQNKIFRTDTHRYAREKACFNYEWVFQVPAPTHFCSVEFFMCDEDTFGEVDEIYKSKVVSLEKFILKAQRRSMSGETVRKKVSHQVLFETPSERTRSEDKQAPPEFDPRYRECRERCWRNTCGRCSCCFKCIKRCLIKCSWYLCCCCQTPQLDDVTPAVLKLELEILSADEARLDPILRESQRFAEPKDRLDWTCALTQPRKFFYNYIGPRNYFQLKRFCIFSSSLICVLLLLAVIYLLLQIILPAWQLRDRMVGTDTA